MGEEVAAVVSWSLIIIKLILMYQKWYALYRSQSGQDKATSDHTMLCSACTTTQEASPAFVTKASAVYLTP